MKRIKGALDWLCIQYPECFNRLAPKPIKLRIEHDLFDSRSQQFDSTVTADHHPTPCTLSKKSLRNAIGYYTRNMRYHRAMLTHSHRINLQGQEQLDDPITQHQRDHAQKIIAIVETKKKKGKFKELIDTPTMQAN